ncbi:MULTISPECIES: alpha/beta fold hydrolase [Sphingobacterium]|uniref:Sigma-B regulation protein RsbQ n=1 Tax=Sphingobacterium zeae TaxID=1776859 RepID=A0ABU0U7D4_9SPHI|nr:MULTISPECIES: alpha/beta hydrolase [Sphingobacterium]MDQ1150871.1 sigma-B regulation protein RsbQ [Sphingobacterium zeae]MDR6736596.1 sigma-B regulation protein RsbQ [Sphingobacterium sp. 2149]
MNIIKRNNVIIKGKGNKTIMFAHGFGCDQNMWRYIYPDFEQDYKIILFDHVGAGHSDLSAYCFTKYDSLEGYASDIIEIATELDITNGIFIGHSVSAMIGLIVADLAPNVFETLIMIGPSPYYINEDNYIGGFSRSEIEELLESMNNNHLGWSMTMAPIIMGNPDKKELSVELASSFCKTDPEIAKHFAKTTFLTDKREMLKHTKASVLILQCSNDIIAPVEVGYYMHQQIPNSILRIMKATGHCPNLSAPQETIEMIRTFLTI